MSEQYRIQRRKDIKYNRNTFPVPIYLGDIFLYNGPSNREHFIVVGEEINMEEVWFKHSVLLRSLVDWKAESISFEGLSMETNLWYKVG